MEEFGSDGYLVFFGILELYGKEYENILMKNPQKMIIKCSQLRHKLLMSQNKIKKILSKIITWEISYEEDKALIYIPKFHELKDNYSYQSLKNIQRDNEETFPRSRSRSRLEEDKEKNPPTPLFSNGGKKEEEMSPEIKKLFQSFPKKV